MKIKRITLLLIFIWVNVESSVLTSKVVSNELFRFYRNAKKRKKSTGDGIVLTSFLVTAYLDLRIKSFL